MFPVAPVALIVVPLDVVPPMMLKGIESVAVVVEVAEMVIASPEAFAEVIVIG
jgi:hypothetical protein